VTALVAGVAFVVFVATSINRPGGGGGGPGHPGGTTGSQSGETQPDQETQPDGTSASDPSTQSTQSNAASTTAQDSLSFAREPTIYIAAATAVAQFLVLIGLQEGQQIDAGTQAAIIGGITALAGLVIRSKVSAAPPK